MHDLLFVAHQRMREDQATAHRHRLTRRRLHLLSGTLKLDWTMARDDRRLVASIAFAWRRRPA